MSVLTDIKNRGVKDTFFLVCDGLKPLPDVVSERVAAHDGPDLHNPFDSEHIPAGVEERLGRPQTRRETDLYRRERDHSPCGTR